MIHILVFLLLLQLIVALKAIGNIGNIGDANYLSGTLTRCMQRTNDIDIRLAAIEGFRRLPCSEVEVCVMVESFP